MTRIKLTIRRIYSALGADLSSSSPAMGYTIPEGRFPTITQSILWDLLPSELAPDMDGLFPPRPLETDWIEGILPDGLEQRLSTAQMARAARQETVAATELKASRLLTPTVTLIAASAALAAYQLKKAAEADTPAVAAIWSLPAILSVLFFTVSALRSLDADVRVGFYKFAEVQADTASRGKDEFLRQSIRAEVLGAYWAKWTANHKKSALMQARAWFSRGIVTLMSALLIAAFTQYFTSSTRDAPILEIVPANHETRFL